MDGCKELPLLLVVFVGLTLFLACSGCTSSTPDISGTWHDSKNAESYYFLQSGNSVKGTVSTLLGSAEFTGKLVGNTLDFNTEFWGQPVSGHIVFSNDGKTAQISLTGTGSSAGTFDTLTKEQNS